MASVSERLRRKCLLFLLSAFLLSPGASAQSIPAALAAPVDESRLVTLRGTAHPYAQPAYDRGAVPDSFAARRMLLILGRPADREAGLQKFLRDVHNPASAQFHRWLTPDEFGARFGPSDSDVQLVAQWLQAHGFSVPRVAKGRNFLEFSGTAAQVRETLHAEIHQYAVNGETAYSISSDAAIPEALAFIIRGFAPLNTFAYDNYVRPVGAANYSPATKKVTPQFTITQGTQTIYALGPEDFATQYDLAPVYKAGIDGTGQTIGIIGDADINLALVDAYRTLFQLPRDNTQVVIDGEDPGPALSPNIEGFLDVEVSGSVAPKATINFYIAGAASFQNPLNLAALRAVEDNQASVLSASFGNCEELLEQSGNQFWSTLWEQAAAQGQTVFVASGDSGPATCPLAVVDNGVETFFGLSVNGLSSTPWNVSVGGTDFYYSDYASGAPSASTLWNQTNDSSLGSLTASLPEQPWDNQFGLNAISPSPLVLAVPSAAGGGGPSSCAQSTLGATQPFPPVCVAGYPKPAWQNAPGVPNDGVRDLPDVSLFAANGMNFSAYPICANPGDCAPVTSGEPQIFLVGGTSASTPAMAGIMALIDQKAGSRQGQANFNFYGLARQTPSVYHDIAVGTNDILCVLSQPGCSNPQPNSLTFGSYGVYAAGPGYDLAGGLGSVDANVLISNWGEITLLPTATSLQLSPSTIVHGSPVAVTVGVQSPSSSSLGSSPSGDVDIATNSAVPPLQSGAISLTGGAGNASINFFPGGTYQVTAKYEGDGVFAPSSSSSATLTVTPEPSSTGLVLFYTYLDYTTNPPTPHSGSVTNGGQVPFGSLWAFESTPAGSSSGLQGLATGSVTFADGQTSALVPVGSNGTAVWTPQLLAVGSHSVTASYSGDVSYNPSGSQALTFTVVKGMPLFTSIPNDAEIITSPNGTPTFPAGSTLVVHVLLESVNSMLPPTGEVTVTLGNQSQALSLTANAYINQSLSTAFVTFPNVAVGTYTLSASYSGDVNWNSATYTYPAPLTFAVQANSVPTKTTVTVSPTSATSASSVSFTVTVAETQPPAIAFARPPSGLVSLYANGTIFADVLVETPVPGNLQASSGVLVVSGSAIPGGALEILANFEGSPPLYLPSTSAPVSLTVTPVDFSMSLGLARVSIPVGQSANVPVLLGGPNGGSVALSLACTPSSSDIGCTVNPAAPSVSGNMSSVLTINAFVPLTKGSSSGNLNPGPIAVGAGLCLVFSALILLERTKRRAPAWCAFAVFVLALASFVAGCAGGSTASTSTSTGTPIPTNVGAPAGTYFVVVTGTSNGVTHNAKLTVIVH